MKHIILVSFFLLFGFPINKKNTSKFEYEITKIIQNFKKGIMEKSECENQKREAGYLSKEINNAIEKEGGYSAVEISNLKTLKIEVEALEDYIGTVGNCGNNMINSENFNLINRRVQGDVLNFGSQKFCINIITVKIGSYIVYLAENNTSKNYTVTYKWKENHKTGVSSGKGEMGLPQKSLRRIYDNRNQPLLKNISVYEISCKEF